MRRTEGTNYKLSLVMHAVSFAELRNWRNGNQPTGGHSSRHTHTHTKVATCCCLAQLVSKSGARHKLRDGKLSGGGGGGISFSKSDVAMASPSPAAGGRLQPLAPIIIARLAR